MMKSKQCLSNTFQMGVNLSWPIKFENQIDFTVLSFAPIVMQNMPKIYWQSFCFIILTDANANGKYKIEKGMVQLV